MLLSVHPRFATAILAGSKTVEVRRQRVAAPAGTPVLLYATAPTMALVGMARIASVRVGSPKEVWSAHRTQTGITRRLHGRCHPGKWSDFGESRVLRRAGVPQRTACCGDFPSAAELSLFAEC
ncbi:ASCH domain-containing protein [Streptomyces sp. NPDC057340]|uniref:ASCH domain-containing protein n=1 Tax=Streptomyces sp. NPDC057340 TaxID=3346103 RepID=UPI00362D685A